MKKFNEFLNENRNKFTEAELEFMQDLRIDPNDGNFVEFRIEHGKSRFYYETYDGGLHDIPDNYQIESCAMSADYSGAVLYITGYKK